MPTSRRNMMARTMATALAVMCARPDKSKGIFLNALGSIIANFISFGMLPVNIFYSIQYSFALVFPHHHFPDSINPFCIASLLCFRWSLPGFLFPLKQVIIVQYSEAKHRIIVECDLTAPHPFTDTDILLAQPTFPCRSFTTHCAIVRMCCPRDPCCVLLKII